MADSEEKVVGRAPMQVSSVKVGGHCIINNRPCKVIEIKTSKTGKHGHAKCNITGTCVLTKKKCNDCHPASHSVVAFQPEKVEYQVLMVDREKNLIQCLDDDLKEVAFPFKDDDKFGCALELADALDKEKEKTFNVVIIKAPVQTGPTTFVDEILIESFKEAKDSK